MKIIEGLKQLKENYDLKQKENGWYIVNEKIECVLDQKEDWKIEKVGQYNLESLEKYFDHLKTSTREKDKVKYEIVKEKLKLLYDYLNEEANSCYLYNNFLDNKDILEISKILKMVKTTYKDTKEQLENFHFQII